MSNDQPTSIRPILQTLCDQLNLPYGNLASLTITPTRVEACLYKRNENGNIQLNEAEALTETIKIPVLT